MQIGGEKSQIFIAILLIVFGLQLIVNPVLYTKHKYISCFRSTRTYYEIVFGRPFVKRFALCCRTVVSPVCPISLSVCDVVVLWPNGWMDQDAIGREVCVGPGHIVLDGDPAPHKRGTAAPPSDPYVQLCCAANCQLLRFTSVPSQRCKQFL